jgi:hypothetical protein
MLVRPVSIDRWRLAYPRVVRIFRDVKLSSPAGEVGQHDTNINASRECAGTKTADRFGRNFREIDRCDNGGLADSKTSDEASSVDLTKAATIRQEDDDTENPHNAELTSSP